MLKMKESNFEWMDVEKWNVGWWYILYSMLHSKYERYNNELQNAQTPLLKFIESVS